MILIKQQILQILRGFYKHWPGQILMTILALMYELYLILITNQNFLFDDVFDIFFRLYCEQSNCIVLCKCWRYYVTYKLSRIHAAKVIEQSYS